MKHEAIAIAIVQDLKDVEKDLAGHYELVQDLVLEEAFVPLGNQFEMFTGTFDGKGHAIKGLRLSEATQYAGLFACNAGTICNLKLEEVDITATAYVGAVAGYNSGLVKNCEVSGSINATSFVGGLVGYNDGSISECRMYGNLEGTAFWGAYTGEKEQPAGKASTYARKLYLSVAGEDGNEGTINSPLCTVGEAQRRVREWIHKKDIGNIEIVFRGGTYYLDAPVSLTEEDCFHDGRTVTYTCYREEPVKLVGGNPVEGWEAWERGIVRAFVGEKQFHVLFVNGELRLPAKAEGDGEMPDIRELRNVYACYSHGFFSEILPVQEIEASTGEVKTAISKSSYSYVPDALMGAVAFIKEPGDWALGTDGYLYYMPGEKDAMEIVIPSGSRIFSLVGTRSVPVEHVIFEGLEFQVTDMGMYLTAQGGRGKEGYDESENVHGALYLENARECVIRKNRFSDCGLNAISLEGASQRNRIEHNQIERMGYAGIHCQGSWIDTKEYINRNNLIFNNHISQVGGLVVHGAGIYLLGSGHNHIYRNLIHDSSRYGISMKGARYGCWAQECGRNLNQEIPFEEHWDYLHSRNNLIEGNEIHDTGTKSLDGGGVEAWGPGKNNVIDYNLVFDYYNGQPTLGWKGHGIFLDDACHYFTVTNNIVYESKKQGADAGIFMKSISDVVRNNIFDVTNTHQGAANISPYVEPCRDQIFTNNIVYADPVGGIGEDGAFVEDGSRDRRMYTCDNTAASDPEEPSIAYIDKNLYFNTSGRLLVSLDNQKPEKDMLWEDYAETAGCDQNSICADPLFVDAKKQNYTLAENSPAYALGFHDIDRSRIGMMKL